MRVAHDQPQDASDYADEPQENYVLVRTNPPPDCPCEDCTEDREMYPGIYP